MTILGKKYLTNRFNVAVRLFTNRSQMTSNCGKNKKVAHEAQPSVSLKSLFFVSKYFNITRKPAFCPTFALPLHEKKPFDVIYDIQNETISLVAMRSNQFGLFSDWSRNKRYLELSHNWFPVCQSRWLPNKEILRADEFHHDI